MRNKRFFPYLILILLVPAAGEFQFYPLPVDFRVSFATPILLLLLLYFKDVHAPLSGLLTGISVVLTRIGLGVFGGEDLAPMITLHLPVLGYYVTYGVLFHFIPIKNYSRRPLFIGLFACLLEVASSGVELTARALVLNLSVTSGLVLTVLFVAVIRSFFVMGFYMMILYHDLQTKEKAQRKKNDNILLVISDLYVELIQLKKSIQTSERTTSESYFLSKQLQEQGNNEMSKRLLQIAGRIHECKKDGQRIYASLSSLINRQEFKEWISVSEIIDLVVRANKSYASFLKKNISFEVEIKGRPVKFHSYFLLSILNNLISNSVEAIEESGRIKITADHAVKEGRMTFSIKDNGRGIEPKYHDVIFSPGFTTKYNASGNPSNGIGLSYIKSVIEAHQGTIWLMRSVPHTATEFTIDIPVTLKIEEDAS
ncbi:HAMP domain-containing sensor histidine kinase [Salipaludibacillus aurantiacus]|uniref:histidine kinase n=1 Tax=Salipaludibacillus aurantiacus TaxID=1601833 RepID=A0A1H9UR92_9BACI|nr:sensor histidine kinase [Salipaludibacillus aurantiacus]SES11878.1 two-component system, sensor histidine kinase YcbA [Salipaludibacillus aurantiacus]